MSQILFPANPQDGDTYRADNGIQYVFNSDSNFWESGSPASLVGDTGATGPQGPEGPIGPIGLTGPQGTGIELKGTVAEVVDLDLITGQELGDTWIVEANGNGYTWNGTIWFDIGQLVGPEGPQGATGPQGGVGDIGPVGPQGDGFTNGTYNPSTGVVQFLSDDGLGFTTQDLRGATGPQGIKGDTGNTGPQGNIGPVGPKGDGFTGGSYNTGNGVVTFSSSDGLGFSTLDLRGATGLKGNKGDKGDTGNQGIQGPPGPQGPAINIASLPNLP